MRITRVGGTIIVSTGPVALPEQLTETEGEVVQAVLAGQTNLEIAELRGKSTKTIANQIYAIYRKLGVRSRDELAALLMRGSAAAAEDDEETSA